MVFYEYLELDKYLNGGEQRKNESLFRHTATCERRIMLLLIFYMSRLPNPSAAHPPAITPSSLHYTLHAVFFHSGEAMHGHYWVAIKDRKWVKYNDSIVTVIDANEVFRDLNALKANAYLLVYIRTRDMQSLCAPLFRQQFGSL